MNRQVIVFVDEDNPDGEVTEVFAVPDHWDDDDIARFRDSHNNGEWTFASVVNVKEIAES